MAKEESVIQTIFKVSNKSKGEALIMEVLSKCENKTDLIKNALFNYIINIQNGNIIDRAYPYNQVGKFTNIEKENIVYNNNFKAEYISNVNDDNEKHFNNETINQGHGTDSEDEYEDEYEDEDNYENEHEEDNLDFI